ncbi:YbgA family protein [Candidatus Thiodiazotropha endoloripes]|uniref:DUF1722 domain-containing protein n=1 Tax=Candidatus Thiodiazotropha endoloripes TaxID=1818881 RepID=A0A1E2UPI1_9GAMM|nr:DUF1722 domain-containing protein [Candidatus Thiodiazotropha endoloripes]ODB96637.1 hypothetical protein A3196_07635 [Candidatus Thiodiazotropha endoloripes]
MKEEERLNDTVLHKNFVNRSYLLQRWQQLLEQGISAAGLIEFHTIHKYLLMAHSQAAYQPMRCLLSNIPSKEINAISECVINELILALKRGVKRKRHVNVLHHINGYLKREIDSNDNPKLNDRQYRGETPLVVPVSLQHHNFRRHPDPYMAKQVYLQPHPDNLGLRNHI